GQATVTGFSFRLSSRVVPLRVVSASTRTASHFTSCDQPASVGTWVPVVASIGRMEYILADRLSDGFSTPHRSHWSLARLGGLDRRDDVCSRSGRVPSRSGSSASL